MFDQLSLFAAPRAFRGEFLRIQRNALKSWTALRPRPQVILCGNEDGVAEACREFGADHIDNVAITPTGAPRLREVFEAAERRAVSDLLAYVNADIILTQDLWNAIKQVNQSLTKFVLVCAPVNLEIREDLDFFQQGWEKRLRALAIQQGQGPTETGADVFVFPKGFFARTPNLAIGRGYWDNWLMWRGAGGPGVDITGAVLAIHQAHAGSTHDREWELDQDVSSNVLSLRWWERLCRRMDLPALLQADGSLLWRPRGSLRPPIGVAHRQASHLKIKFLERTYRIRRRTGLYRWWRASTSLPEHQ